MAGDSSIGGLVGSFDDDGDSDNYIYSSSSSVDVTGSGGLIGGAVGATLGDLENMSATGNVIGSGGVGGLLGGNSALGAGEYAVSESYATGNVTDTGIDLGELGNMGFGGLVGVATYVYISDSYATGDVTAETGNGVGGLLGVGIVELNSTYATGDVVGDDMVGGNSGYLSCADATTEISFSTGSATGVEDVGGFVGLAEDGCTFRDVYSTGAVTSQGTGGGFAATVDDVAISDSYAAGVLSADTAGGFIAVNNGESSITNSFWDSELSGVSESDGGTAKTSSQMKSIATYTTELGEEPWDFVEVWSMSGATNNGYPCQQWVEASCEVIESEANVINISNCQQLFAITGDNRFDTIRLTKNIDCSGVSASSLFSQADPFRGIFNGNFYTISNVVLDEEDESDVGIISAANGATIKNVNLNNIEVVGSLDVGTILGDAMNDVTLTNIHASNIDITVADNGDESGYVGGLVGDFDTLTNKPINISNLSASGEITLEDEMDNIGGLFGQLEAQNTTVNLNKLAANVDIISEDGGGDYGGLFGEIEADSSDDAAYITLTNAYAWGNISDPDNDLYNTGGLTGRVDNESYDGYESIITLSRVYATGDIDTYEAGGGLVGHFDGSEDGQYIVKDSFATGLVDVDETEYGGIFGDFDQDDEEPLTFQNVYYDQTQTDQEFCGNEDDEYDGCSPVNTDGSQNNYFVNNKTRQPMAMWNFASVWKVNSNTPPTFIADLDQDGILDAIEQAGPNGGDANNDGIADVQQAYVASFINSSTNAYSSLQVNSQCTISSVGTISEAEGSGVNDVGFDYPAGLMNFTIDCAEQGFTADIVQYHFDVQGDYTVRKYIPQNGAYTNMPGATTSSSTIGGQTVKISSYQVTEGSVYDIDGISNTVIKDPAGLAKDMLGSPNTGIR